MKKIIVAYLFFAVVVAAALADNTAIPSNLMLIKAWPTSIVMAWQAPAIAVNSYTVQASTSADFSSDTFSVNSVTTTATISGLTRATTYYVRANTTLLGSTGPWTANTIVQTLSTPAPPLDRYGGFSSVSPDAITGVHYKYWSEPDPNEFEYRAILNDIFMLADVSTAVISGCDQWRTINLILEHRIDPYLTYPPGVFRSTIPFDDTSLVYFTTGAAVAMNLISSTTINSQVAYSTIQICMEGKIFPY